MSNQTLVSKISSIYDFFQIPHYITSKTIQSCCAVHKGDNPTAFTLYHDQENPQWVCWSHNCQQKFGSDLTGFIQGILCSYHQKVSRVEATIWFENFKPTESIQQWAQIEYEQKEHKKRETKGSIVPFLNCPSPYFIQRGFSPEILMRYSIGDHPMGRTVIPIFDHTNQYVGWTGRSLYSKCNQCKFYHNGTECRRNSKWFHRFPRSEVLYNFNHASRYIASKKVVILTESPGNCLRFSEASCYNNIGMFGTRLTHNQYELLAKSNAMAVILIMDGDEAGLLATEKLRQQLEKRFIVFSFPLFQCDVADLTIKQVQTDIVPFINRVEKLYK